MSPLGYSLLATFGVSLISFVGVFFLAMKVWNERFELRVLSFAAGVLLATVFLDLLPEAIEASGGAQVLIATLLAIIGLFLVERVIHGRHDHAVGESHVAHHTTARYIVLVGDGVHNAIDGVAIGASFLVSPELGLVTTLAVFAHEIPHEVADYAILVRGGYSRRKALFLNFLSALAAVAGAGAVFLAGDFVEANLGWFLAATAGMFLYLAMINLMPELHHQRLPGRFMYSTPLLFGALLISLLVAFLPA